MSNTDRAADVLRAARADRITLSPEASARALADAGLLAPEPRIIRTREELAALDPETILFRPYDDAHDTIMPAVDFLSDYDIDPSVVLPAVIVSTGEQVRAARQALKEASDATD